MAVVGRVAIVPKDNYDVSKTYKRLDAVMHNNTLYIAKKDVPTGAKPGSDTEEYWMGGPSGGVGVPATTGKIGSVKPDGKTVSTDQDGTISVNLDGDTITLDQAQNIIKLADVLKEKINGAFPAANVANNQVTTEAGFALDARQANPNVTGSLGAQIAQLNSNLKFKENWNTTLINCTGTIMNWKHGNIAMMSVEITPSKITHGLLLVQGLYPPRGIIFLSFNTIDGYVVPMILNTDGTLSMYYPYNTSENPNRIDGCFTYICV